MPPPEPRSSTVSPGFNSARAVGFPQPSEASTAASGNAPVCAASYSALVMGSTQPGEDGDAPQHALPDPAATRSAAAAYFSFTVSVMVGIYAPCFFANCRTAPLRSRLSKNKIAGRRPPLQGS